MAKPLYQPVLPRVRLVSATDDAVVPLLLDPAVVVVSSDESFDDVFLLPPPLPQADSATNATATTATAPERIRPVRTIAPPPTGRPCFTAGRTHTVPVSP